ncbi:hypothetical protein METBISCDRAFT_28244 [Metschnikowia bicuspidata]|uniref:Uncharacterized protein n=1 Tax=Metschnikowia bicuspidata TaxID=27322 RepID=A0A4P9Z9H4_9ASCO|nr:hypothetical protein METBISCDRAFT_28244 [Metschnikowia bicuspidata]
MYVRSTDNVFRRKDATKHGDTVLNELIECGLRVPDPDPASAKHNQSVQRSPDLFSEGQWLHGVVFPCADRCKVIDATVVPEHANARLERADIVPGNLVQGSVSSIEDHGVVFTLGLDGLYGHGFRPTYSPLLVYYGMIVAHLLKLVLAWVLFTGAVCWYFGLMTLPAGTDFAKSTSPQNALKTAENYNPQVDTTNDRLRLHSGAEMSLERKPPPASKEERHLSDLASSVVNVVPFLAARRESVPRSVDTTPNAECKEHKRHRDFISQKLLQIKHGKRAQSVSPDQPSNSRRHLSPSLLEKDPPARKPPLVHLLGLKLELPFACEMKLRLNAGSEAAHPADNESGVGLKRTGTTASQKSVLDTRGNYSKFLANFSE